MNADLKVHFSSTKDDWETPLEFFDGIEKLFGKFDLDVCATFENTQVYNKYYTSHGLYSDTYDYGIEKLSPDNGLTGKWSGRCWMNPPYSKPEKKCTKNCVKKGCLKRGSHNKEYKPGQIDFIKKAISESREGTEVIALVPARPDTKIFQLCYENAREILFVRGRLTFEGAKDPAPFPSMIVKFYGTGWDSGPEIGFLNTKGELI